jgi:hypothetical protein
MKLLQNKPVDGRKPREEGFVVIVDGGPGLQRLAELSHRQKWNHPVYTARYVVSSEGALQAALKDFLADLHGFAQGDPIAAGSLLPDPAANMDRWLEDVETPLKEAIAAQPTDDDVQKLLEHLAGLEDRFLPTGARLVILIECRHAPEKMEPDRVGLTQDVVARLGALPQRMGIVLSGLPRTVAEALTA